MPRLIRSAKSGSAWEANDLRMYNITASDRSPEEFFLNQNHPHTIDHDILYSPAINPNPNLSPAAARYLRFLQTTIRFPRNEGAVDVFVLNTLTLLNFDGPDITVTQNHIIPLTICGDTARVAQTDVCLMHLPSGVLLVLIESKSATSSANAEPQVIAQAIAAFQSNNRIRKLHGLAVLPTTVIPCITMLGTHPAFYLVPVTEALSTAVIGGRPCDTETDVSRFQFLSRTRRQTMAGMEDPEYRRQALENFLAFKEVARSHWEQVLQGF